ncbi:MAG TPA: adenylate/guanylate cyclase domain-containing protein [Miltoncostaeaceae bacterium]|nr:adenylate/guanylate cyclase domain-containing protein [Miltoncostaeaceae bacterium]
MRCPGCESDNAEGARFCASCGRRLAPPACPSCGAAAEPSQRFCAACGTPLTPGSSASPVSSAPGEAEGARKQVTVLFCDIVGSTALAEHLGAEAMHELLGRFFELALAEVHRYGGTIDKFLGDGFMALVGAPVAHEDHARRALLAALGIRRRLEQEPLALDRDGEPLTTRMGINSGMVVLGNLGDGVALDFTAIGDAINVAARLEAAAAPGEILISEATARLVAGYVRTEPLGPVELRGREAAVHAHRVVGHGRRRSPLRGAGGAGLSAFVGRERQLSALNDLLDEVREGRGQVVGVVGEPGMGKTRLVSEFRGGLSGERLTILEGRCLSYGAAIPWVPVADIVRANCRIADTDSPEEVARKVRHGLAQVGIEGDDAAFSVLHMLGMGEATEALGHLSPEAVKARTIDTLLQMSLNGSRRRPIIFVVEDLHWIDRVSEEFFTRLVDDLQGAPILLACTYRPGYAAPWMQRSYATQIALPRLGTRDALAVVRSILDAQEGGGQLLAEGLISRAEGNPFFLEELARAARDRSDLDAVARVPETVQDVLAARVDRLPEEPRRVLQTASVLGREFPLRLLERVWDAPAPVGPHLAELTRLEFIHELQGLDERAFVFKHALTQDVAYDGLLTSRRKRLHEAAGAALEELYEGRLEEVYDRLAHHYSRTDRSDKAVHYLDRFAERAVRTYAHAEAAKALREALVHVERLPAGERERRAVDLVLRLVNSLYFLGRFGESLDLLLHQEPAVARIGDPWLTGPFAMWLGHTYTHAGDSDGAARSISRAVAEADGVGDLATIGKSHYVMAREGFWLGRLAEGAEHGRRAVAALSRTGDWWWLAHSYCWTALNLCNLGRFEEALAEVARARAIGEERADPRIHSYSSWNAGWIQATRGEWEAAIADCTESLETSPDTLNSSYSMGWLGFAYREKGDLDEAVRHLEQSIALLTEFRYSRLVAWFKGWLSEAHLWAGDVDQALTVADQALRVARELRYLWGMALARRALGRIAMARGALGEAERHLGEALRPLEGMGARFDAACVGLSLAEVAARRGDPRLGGSRLSRCLADFAELRTPRWTDRALRLARELGLEPPAPEPAAAASRARSGPPLG